MPTPQALHTATHVSVDTNATQLSALLRNATLSNVYQAHFRMIKRHPACLAAKGSIRMLKALKNASLALKVMSV